MPVAISNIGNVGLVGNGWSEHQQTPVSEWNEARLGSQLHVLAFQNSPGILDNCPGYKSVCISCRSVTMVILSIVVMKMSTSVYC